MIEVIVSRAQHGIHEISISGHANAGAYGADIVCSAVSGISFGILNAIQPLTGITPDVAVAQEGGGFLKWSLSSSDDEATREKQQLLAESMVIALLSVEANYGKYVKVNDRKWQGGV
ncbi:MULTISPECIES: ribosomal-processing cysteine protease Prp [Brevibacillus]|uniref:Ribosomal processing cysteine protease Prp n=2 Tax=Brevibacillus TaxID=55080 RepID=A0A2Z4MFT9_BREBE|nr:MULTISPECIES: ribosomal-processing cysteine protease Prp [Brevibacillus]AWX55304.1 ribosomal-processing cysteine protease Prp [Brevibacillus brevis]MED1783659.1 ribosomal-processing cysteine protease Prp [Brevibacillus fortis]NRR23133.1 ribosomal-processing cysteine protease Prp [Brevibacillus sp. MS2.2]PSJ95090.1 ribosomal-processing cysteine protease Prp [Brevibacillus fortis]RAT96203.1 ribosomal-processing cysteine protease Prp [Brevibacillus sp. Leaf182]